MRWCRHPVGAQYEPRTTMSAIQATAPGSESGSHGAVWEMSHHPIHSAAAAVHWVVDENAHEEHPHLLPRHYFFIERATMCREMERL